MAFVDPEQLEAMLGTMRASYEAYRGENDLVGSVGRAWPMVETLYRFIAAEIARDTPPAQIAHASAFMIGTLAAAAAISTSQEGGEAAILDHILGSARNAAVQTIAKPTEFRATICEGRVS